MKAKAAVAHKAGAPLTIETVDVEGPKAGEVLVEIRATGICHTDEFTLSGADPEGLRQFNRQDAKLHSKSETQFEFGTFQGFVDNTSKPTATNRVMLIG
jgi:hypothetical protein